MNTKTSFNSNIIKGEDLVNDGEIEAFIKGYKKGLKKIKIGRFFYKRISQDNHGEPIGTENLSDEDLYYLTCDGEAIEYFKRVRKTQKEVQKR